jgi:hypothetical protein
LVLLERRPPERVVRSSSPVAENQHMTIKLVQLVARL